MMNDGGAERMVRSKKIQWYQIVMVVVMGLFMCVVAVMAYFMMNGGKLANIINKWTFGDGYELIAAISENYEEIAVYGYEETDDSLSIEFRYYDDVLDNDTDLIALSYEVKTFIEDYLSEHPDDAINTNQKKVDMRFPDVHYSNFLEDEEFEYSSEFLYVTYEYSGVSASEFVSQIEKIEKATVLVFDTDAKEAVFEDDVDFSGLSSVEGLTEIVLEEEALSAEQAEALSELCDELGILWTAGTEE